MTSSGFRVFDSDMHCVEPPDLWERYIDSHYRHQAPRGSEIAFRCVLPYLRLADRVMPALLPAGLPPDTIEKALAESPPGRLIAERQSRRFGSFYERGWSPQVHLEAMDAEGVDRTVVFPTSGLLAMGVDDIDDDFAAAIARAYNDWLYDYCQADPTRLIGAAMLSPHDVDAALKESERAVRELGFRAVFLRPNPIRDRQWYDPVYEPLWSQLEALDVALGFHEGIGSLTPQTGGRFGANVYLRHVACHPLEMMLAVMALCGGGVLERHPRLRVAFLEANCSWIPWLLDRLDDHYEIQFGISRDALPSEPSSYFKRQCFASLEADERGVASVLELIGDDNIVFSTDWPHPDSKYPDAVRTLLAKTEIPEASMRKILWDNCCRLYGLSDDTASDAPRAAG